MTRQPDFTGVRIKVERAKEHFSDLQARVERFQEDNPYEAIPYYEPDTGDLVYKAKIPDQPPPYWSAIVGDCVHNLRSSLDLLVCELIRAEGNPIEEHTGFPIYRSADAFANVLKSRDFGKVKGAREDAVDLIMKAKPYKGANNPFWSLRELDVEDKHKLLVPIGAAHHNIVATVHLDEVLPVNPGKTTTLAELAEMIAAPMGITAVSHRFPLKDGAEIYRVPASLHDNPRAQMYMNPEISIVIAFGEVEVVKGEPLTPTLLQFSQFVERFIELFPPLFSQGPPPDVPPSRDENTL
jgi:hypothetical protein